MMLGEVIEFAQLLRLRWCSQEALAALRLQKLRWVVRQAYDRVPYYRTLMERSGFRPEDVTTLEHLRYFPVTTKDDLRQAGEAALSTGAGALLTRHTSGYSGKPFTVRMTPGEDQRRRLREFRALRRVGLKCADRMVMMGTERQRPQRLHKRLGLYRLDIIRGTLSVEEQTQRLKQAAPTVLWVYPTILRAVLLQQDNRLSRVARPRILVTSSEVCDPVLQHQITRDWPVEMFNFYGAAEVGRIAAECSRHTGLHVEADAVIVELLVGDRPAAPGEAGRVVVTSLDQHAMPFIRYELGDLCVARDTVCSCGWPTPLLEAPLGRSSDMVTFPDGSQLSEAPLDFALRTETDLRQFRFVQERVDRVEVHLVYAVTPSPEHLATVRQRLEAVLRGQVQIAMRLVPEIHPEGAKFKTFISRLPQRRP
jgi:phenylacetate-CoA ligase